ncbi:catechol 1,2-dioxygenase [Aliidongia dinghuensis]|uniref:Catechol 1,2-dioxygenase n=1 Tax=Aliidongia dinghuensis TaxID=1867774 RepID=A0A8J2Z004_9PROT|nr:dioxygenase [Aliidongia dinghuensis]GGF48580.1 catechol 1,2-dioxygenase [Aliidongia dinghuensis]
MIIEGEEMVTAAVLAAMDSTPDPRLRDVMASLVRHLHAFVRDIRPSEAEFERAIEFLNRIGRATHDLHNEGILIADVLGVSTLVGLLNNPTWGGETEAALLGPFWRAAAPDCALGDDIARSATPGPALFARGRVLDGTGRPIAGALVDVWQASPVGLYENQDPDQADMNLRGRFLTDAEGRWHFRSVKPAGYPVPVNGPVGDLLRAQHRPHYRPAHVHFMVSAEGYETLVTQVFLADCEHLRRDVTFSVIPSLIGDFVRHEDPAEAPGPVDGPWYSLDYDFTLRPGERRFPTPPIR